MNLRLLLQSVVFVVEGLLLVLVFSAVLHFEIARLLFAIAIAALCLIAEVFVVVKAAQHLWKWSGRLAEVIVRCVSVKVKQEDRVGWCQALHTVVSRGKGMGSILFHAFPQEVINSIAARTGGIRTQVQCPVQRVRVVVESDCLYSVRGDRKEFLLRMDSVTKQIVKDR